MKEIIRIMEESGAKKRIQKSVNMAVTEKDNIPQEVINDAVVDIICLEANKNEKLGNAILEYAVNETIPKIVAELEIKYQPESNDEEVPLSV